MVGKTNVGGGTKLFAAIGVTYPAGSTLTCTNGTKTLKAKTTTGQWVFAIPEAGTWTVTATDGTHSKSQDVSITGEAQFESVELSYAVLYYENGTEHISMEPIKDSVDNGFYGSVSEAAAFVSMSTGTFSICLGEISSASVDLSKISTLKCKISGINCTGDKNATGLRISVCSSKTAYNVGNRADAAVANYISANLNADTEYSLDVSNISGGYIGVYAYGSFSPAGSAAFNLLRLWGE